MYILCSQSPVLIFLVFCGVFGPHPIKAQGQGDVNNNQIRLLSLTSLCLCHEFQVCLTTQTLIRKANRNQGYFCACVEVESENILFLIFSGSFTSKIYYLWRMRQQQTRKTVYLLKKARHINPLHPFVLLPALLCAYRSLRLSLRSSCSSWPPTTTVSLLTATSESGSQVWRNSVRQRG